MKIKKRRGAYRRRARISAAMGAIAFVLFFFLVWEVHAFDLKQALLSQPPHAASVLPAPKAQTTVQARALSPPVVEANIDRWSDGDVVSALSSFYQTIITFMGLLLGIIGILAVLTLRFLSKAAAEDMAHDSAKEAMRHYLDTRQFGEAIEFALQETAIASQLEQLARDMDQIKAYIKSQQAQRPDNEDADGTIVPGPEDE